MHSKLEIIELLNIQCIQCPFCSLINLSTLKETFSVQKGVCHMIDALIFDIKKGKFLQKRARNIELKNHKKNAQKENE